MQSVFRGILELSQLAEEAVDLRSSEYSLVSKYPPAKPGALGREPLKAAAGVANAAPNLLGHLKVADQRNRFN